MTELSSKQKKYLKSQANTLKPVVQIGKSGVTSKSIENISQALDTHELLKIKFIAFKEEKSDFLDMILDGSRAQFVSLIGHILTIYREHEEKEKRKFSLPK